MNEPRDILNIDEAAELLGVSVKTFNKVLHTANLPARKIGREWKFSRQALIDWVGTGRSQDFYEGSNGHAAADSGDGGADNGELPQREILPHAAPSERPRTRRTAGWSIDLD